MSNKVIKIPISQLGIALQTALGLDELTLVSIKKISSNSDNVSVVFQHNFRRYKYTETTNTIDLYEQVIKNHKREYVLIYTEVK